MKKGPQSSWLFAAVVLIALQFVPSTIFSRSRTPAHPDSRTPPNVDMLQEALSGPITPSGGTKVEEPADQTAGINVVAAGIFSFPLQVSNEWVYEKVNAAGVPEMWSSKVDAKQAGSPSRVLLTGYLDSTDPILEVEYGPAGEVMDVRPEGSRVLYKLGETVGSHWIVGPSLSGGCQIPMRATLASRTETVKVPAGEFADVVRIDYASACTDIGPISEWFASGVGLIKRTESTIAGPIASVLVSARVGGVVLPDHPGGTSLTLDRTQFILSGGGAEQVSAVFRVHNQTCDTLDLTFEECVNATVTMVDDWGRIVAEQRVEVGPCKPGRMTKLLEGETLALAFTMPLTTSDKAPLPAGHYSLIAVLNTVDEPVVRPASTAHIQISTAPLEVLYTPRVRR